jgi:hypothetical protein
MIEFHDTYNMTKAKMVYIIHNTHSIMRIKYTQDTTLSLDALSSIVKAILASSITNVIPPKSSTNLYIYIYKHIYIYIYIGFISYGIR